jgi:hypothetical protein
MSLAGSTRGYIWIIPTGFKSGGTPPGVIQLEPGVKPLRIMVPGGAWSAEPRGRDAHGVVVGQTAAGYAAAWPSR